MTLRQKIGFFLGPFLFFTLRFLEIPAEMNPAAWKTLAVTLWMAVWWLTEAVPISVTALLPLFLFPMLNVADVKAAAAPYANPLVFMFMGGFIIAAAMQKWNLHKRLALWVLSSIGSSLSKIVLGFMLACALLSMWMNNTAVAMMMMPIGLSVITIFPHKEMQKFGTALMLGIAYSSSIGGLGTLIGSTPNAMFAGFFLENYQWRIDFASWFLLGGSSVVILIPITWLLLTKILFRLDEDETEIQKSYFQDLLKSLGKISRQEMQILIIFVFVVFLWMFQTPLSQFFNQPGMNNTTIAMLGALLLFLTPVEYKQGKFLLDANWYKSIDWGVLMLFGGGLSLATMISQTGLAEWLGQHMGTSLAELSVYFIVLTVTVLIVFMTELTSNTASAATFIPIMASLAGGMNLHPIFLTLPVALGATCAFMLPISTPPNAIVYSSGKVAIQDMIKAGFILNIICSLILSLLIYFLAPMIFQF